MSVVKNRLFLLFVIYFRLSRIDTACSMCECMNFKSLAPTHTKKIRWKLMEAYQLPWNAVSVFPVASERNIFFSRKTELKMCIEANINFHLVIFTGDQCANGCEMHVDATVQTLKDDRTEPAVALLSSAATQIGNACQSNDDLLCVCMWFSSLRYAKLSAENAISLKSFM